MHRKSQVHATKDPKFKAYLDCSKTQPQSEKQPPRGVVKTKTVFLSSFGYFLGSPALVPSAWLSSPFHLK